MLCDYIEGSFNVRNEDVSVSDIDSELMLQSLMHMNAGRNIEVTSFVSPVSIERNRHSLSKNIGTFQRSGSILLSLLWTHFMILLATSPG